MTACLGGEAAIRSLEPFCSRESEAGVVFAIDRKATVLVPRYGCRPAFVELVLTLNNLALRGRHVGSKSEEEASGNTFLKRDSCTWIGIVSSKCRVDRQTGKPRQLLNATAHLTGNSFRDQRAGAEIRRRCSGLLSCLSASNQVDNIGRRQGGIRNVVGAHLVDGTYEIQT